MDTQPETSPADGEDNVQAVRDMTLVGTQFPVEARDDQHQPGSPDPASCSHEVADCQKPAGVDAGIAGAAQAGDAPSQDGPHVNFKVEVGPAEDAAKNKLHECEEVIDRSLVNAFVAAGKALKIIRDEELYMQTSSWTFDEYARRRWGIGRIYAHRLIKAAEVYENLLPIGNTDSPLPLPTHEAQVRSLAQFDADTQRRVWTRAARQTHQKVPSALEVKEAIRVVVRPKLKKSKTSELSAGAGENSEATQADPTANQSTKETACDDSVPGKDEAGHPIAEAATSSPEFGHPVATEAASKAQSEQAAVEPGAPQGLLMAEPDMAAQEGLGVGLETAPTAFSTETPDPASAAKSQAFSTDARGVSHVVTAPAVSLFPDHVVRKAVAAVKRNDVASADGTSLAPAICHFIPALARLMNQEASQLEDFSAEELSRALRMANTKLQVALRRL